MPSIRFCFISLISLFFVASLQAQDTPSVPAQSLNDANTTRDILGYITEATAKLNLPSLKPEEQAAAIAGVLMPASEKLLELATTPAETRRAHLVKISAFNALVQSETEGAEQQFEAFLDGLAATEDFVDVAETGRYRFLAAQMLSKESDVATQKFATFLKTLDAKEKTEARTKMSHAGQFLLFTEKTKKAEITPENFAKFKTELKDWSYGKHVPIEEIASLGFGVAYQHNIPAEQMLTELSEHIQASTLSAEEKKTLIEGLEVKCRFAPGVDPKLYGKTLDDKDFDWASLRGKYVLIKFTATWCQPCKATIPKLLEAYAKYKDKGLEIVSVYSSEYVPDAVELVKKSVEEAQLPWIVLSGALTEKASQPSLVKFYGISAVPTIVLVDKEGKVIQLVQNDWKKKLAEIFE